MWIFQARVRMLARQIDVAGGHLEVAMDEVHQPVRQVSREIRAVVGGSVFLQAARDVDARITLGGELDVGVGFVVAQQDVVARLPLLDEVVLERQSFFFVVDLDEVDLPRVVDQRAGLDVGQALIEEIAADPGAKVLGLADVDHRAMGVLVQIHSGQGRKFGRTGAQLGGTVLYLNCGTRILRSCFICLYSKRSEAYADASRAA